MSAQYTKAKNFVVLATVGAMVWAYAPEIAARPLKRSKGVELEHTVDLVDLVVPAVVNIRVVSGGAAAGRPDEDASEGQGSGFIVTPDGKVVTNFHVVDGGDAVTVDFANGEQFPAKIVGTDRETDLALLQIVADRDFDYVEFHQGRKAQIGEWVLAIGNPFGIGQSSSVGIISAITRERVHSGSYVDYLQTDAAVNRGNSGGPLFNLKGEVVGVNSAIYSPTGASVGIAFAVPADLAIEIIADLIKHGKVNRGFLGVGLREAVFEQAGVVYRGGATIEHIGAGSPADKAGMRVEDIILKVGKTDVRNATEATRAIAKLRAGERANFQIERHEDIMDIQVIIGARPDDKEQLNIATGKGTAQAAQPVPTPKVNSMQGTGLSLVDLSATFRDTIGMARNQVGVYVDAVAPGSSAAQKGIKSGMVILKVDNKPAASVPIFRRTIEDVKKSGRRSASLLIRTINGSETYTSISLN